MLQKSGRVGRRNIHRGRTGNAERAVVSTQYSVLRSVSLEEDGLMRKVALGFLAAFFCDLQFVSIGTDLKQNWWRCGVGVCLMGAEICCARMW